MRESGGGGGGGGAGGGGVGGRTIFRKMYAVTRI